MPNKVHLIITAAVFIILASALGYVAFQQNAPAPKVLSPSQTAPSATSQPTPTPAPQPNQPAAPAADTSTWQTYRNKKYGFEFKYPVNLKLIEGENDIQLLLDKDRGCGDCGILILLDRNPNRLKFLDLVFTLRESNNLPIAGATNKTEFTSEFKRASINGMSVWEHQSGGIDGLEQEVFFYKELFFVSALVQVESIKEYSFLDILGTFKFTS